MGNGDEEADITVKGLNSRTKDALEVEIECSFQYKVMTDVNSIVTIFEDWGEEYETAFVKIARDVLRDSMAKFEVL